MPHSKIEVVPATIEHCIAVARKPREADRVELWSMARMYPIKAMEEGLKKSTYARAGIIDGVTVCVFGVTPAGFFSRRGIPWLVSSWEAERRRMAFLRGCNDFDIMEMFEDRYTELTNYVHADNNLAILWLKWMGFDLSDPAPMGYDGDKFHKFTMRRPECAHQQF